MILLNKLKSYLSRAKSGPGKLRLPAFTLVEVIVYTFLLSAITVGISGILFQLYRVQSVVNDRANLTENLRQVHKLIRDDMYLSDGLSVDSNGDLVLTSSFNSPNIIRYTLSDDEGRIYRVPDSGTALPITTSNIRINSFNIEDVTSSSIAPSVRITIDMSNYEQGLLRPPIDSNVTTTLGLKFVI